MLVFVSHTHADEQLARALVAMLEGRFVISQEQLRCTSLPGYQLELGDRPEITLRNELASAKFVIGLITASSLQSSWVLSELGASWGLNKKLGLLIFPGVADDDLPSLFRNLISVDLRGPDRGPHEFAMADSVRARLRSLLDEINVAAGLPVKVGVNPDNIAQNFIDEVCKYTPLLRARELLVTREHMLAQRAYGMNWAQITAYAQDEIRIWGWSCMNVLTGNSRNIFREWLSRSRDRRLRILVLDPDAVATSKLDFGPVCDVDHKDVVRDMMKTITDLRDWRLSLGVAADQVVLLKTRWNITSSGVAIDIGPAPDSSNGVTQSEYYSYKTGAGHLDKRPNVIVRRGSPFWPSQHMSVTALFASGENI